MTRALFLLLTYRQEKYVAEAVRSALAQEGAPLDILISDDCSPDGTWEAIRAASEGYAGPHRVTLNRNDRNLGLTGHINKCVSDTTAERIIVAAGDDISLPHRSVKTLAAFEATDALLVHAKVDVISESGVALDGEQKGAKLQETTSVISCARSMGLYVGATGAWHRSLFTRYGPLPEGIYEDLILGFRAALEGRVAFVDEPLVRYRADVGISAPKDPRGSRAAYFSERRKTLERGVRTFEVRMADAEAFGLGQHSRIMRILRAKRNEYIARQEMLETDALGALRKAAALSPGYLRAWRSERRREKLALER